ncbi:hypothetical protein QFZ41_002908 [Luteibacter sp. W1I16]|uniref:hypothetical protein n=1 Tax=Luteibacter sp. W1I16 TaxID=3373922 RepID=UPI003D1958A2
MELSEAKRVILAHRRDEALLRRGRSGAAAHTVGAKLVGADLVGDPAAAGKVKASTIAYRVGSHPMVYS